MHLEGEHTISASRGHVWEQLNDAGVLARITPGLQELQAQGEDSYQARFAIKMGPINSTFSGTLRVVDRVAPERFRLLIDVAGTAGSATAEALVTATPVTGADPEQTRVTFAAAGQAHRAAGTHGTARAQRRRTPAHQAVFSGFGTRTQRRFAATGGVISGGGFMSVSINVTVNGRGYQEEVEPRLLLAGLPARRPGADGNPRRLRYQRLRRLYHHRRRQGSEELHPAGGAGGRRRRHHHRGAGEQRRAAPVAGGLPRGARPAVRLLHGPA